MSTATQVRESPEPRDIVYLTNVTVPLPDKLNLKGDLAQNWRTFRRRWESFEVSSRKTKRSHDERVTTFQQCLPADVCDVSNGFWHVKLDEESSLLTTFETPLGRYKWKRMPFGISPAPEVFQRRSPRRNARSAYNCR